MSNPWLKKNPFLSLWLSGAHSVAGAARGTLAAEAKRQTQAAMTQATNEMFAAWTDALTGAAKPKRAARPTAPRKRSRK